MDKFKSWTFEWWEVALIKICLISLGILLALYFYDYVAGLTWLWWVFFAATGAYFVVRCFQER
ncbi:MAG: hypothetical protein A2942_04045 [Candidatus Lloydbacteria bacterium RIFCSPLOWO2_01_FULL_50_20]|uniref:Uncharacterized protein n=1 Tax=Candidatus Lloydbacteria bacterium RIFCSPLOWO2_01_FULL_50_20 TaxID=1798665 RepID=A0A1G2DCH7_9BACT|nr:MAG: hypothetical protein A3C13_00210 [Candidatus Lloydbacteria bacterium RIFCSPHIGHO2_02_FULL_50_11]OGZ11357.1 MAG: hypothetical protein A2942_04045 [Candidatus Lloydbacteria bacterium RIFCSPLOWO2_01_FULL_50_20]